MFKRKLCFLLACSFLLTGCSSANMTQAESGQVAEYIAYSLLKYHNNPGAFITETEKPVAPEAEASAGIASIQPATGNNTSASAQPAVSPSATVVPEQKNATAGEVFGNKDFQVTVRRKGLYASYPKNASSTYFALTPEKNKKLLVLELKAKNTSNSDLVFKTSGAGLEYVLEGSDSNEALTTILEHDIHFVKETVKPGKHVKSLIIFEVDKNFDDSKLSLSISKAEKSVTVAVN